MDAGNQISVLCKRSCSSELSSCLLRKHCVHGFNSAQAATEADNKNLIYPKTLSSILSTVHSHFLSSQQSHQYYHNPKFKGVKPNAWRDNNISTKQENILITTLYCLQVNTQVGCPYELALDLSTLARILFPQKSASHTCTSKRSIKSLLKGSTGRQNRPCTGEFVAEAGLCQFRTDCIYKPQGG